MEMEVACRSVQRLADLLLVTNAHAIPWHVYYVRWLWELLLCHVVWLIIFFPLRGAIPGTSLAGTGTIHTQHTHTLVCDLLRDAGSPVCFKFRNKVSCATMCISYYIRVDIYVHI